MTETLEYSEKDFKEATDLKCLKTKNTLETYEKIENLSQKEILKKKKKKGNFGTKIKSSVKRLNSRMEKKKIKSWKVPNLNKDQKYTAKNKTTLN